jgi:PadR family transcriptional regulator, regulatory protein PadR
VRCGCFATRNGPVRAAPVEGMLEGVILLLLAEHPLHGYELLRQITGEGLMAGSAHPGRVYETLARLASAGCVSTKREPNLLGPERLRHTLTANGVRRLARWIVALEQSHERVTRFLKRYQNIKEAS